MNDETIKTGEYSQFNSAASKVNELTTSIEDKKSTIAGYQSSLNNESVFAGPICDSCVEGFTNLNNMLSSLISNFTTIKGYINSSLNNYQDADAAAIQFLNIKEDGSLYTSTQQYSSNQALVDSLYPDLGKVRSDFGFYGAWCAQYVSYKLKENGYKFESNAVVDNLMHNLEDAGFAIHTGSDYTAQPGDIVSMDFDNNGVGNHIEIVVKDNGDGTVSTIGGNTSSKYCVAERTRTKDGSDCKILKYATPTKEVATTT